MFILSFKNGDNDPTKTYFDKYFMPLVKIKDFNALIDNKLFFDQTKKTNKKCMKNRLKCQETIIIQQETFYLYHQKYYKLIDIDLSRQANTNISRE